jgi:hypothetical protein
VITSPVISSTEVSGGHLILSGTGGAPNGNYVVLWTTNVAAPTINWVPIATNAYDSSGNFNWTNTLIPGIQQSFFRIKQ